MYGQLLGHWRFPEFDFQIRGNTLLQISIEDSHLYCRRLELIVCSIPIFEHLASYCFDEPIMAVTPGPDATL